MEFASRHKCIEHYQSQFPNLPRYMVEMALDYDLATSKESSSNEKPLTNKEKRQQKRNLKQQKEQVKRTCTINEQLKEALDSGQPLELDCAQVIKGSDYKMPPFIKGHIEVDGQDVADSMQSMTDANVEEIEEDFEEIDAPKDSD